MKKPTAYDFVVDVTDTHVNVVFNPNGSLYTFGRLVDPDDIAHYGPLCHGVEPNGRAGGDGEYAGGRSSGAGACFGYPGGLNGCERVIHGAAQGEHSAARQELV